jgi:hypothetical protein
MEHSALFWLFNGAVVISVSALTIYCARIRKGSGKYLCDDCRFNDPTSCLKAERPKALICTSYRQGAAMAEGKIAEDKIAKAKSTIIVDADGAPVAAERAADLTGTGALNAEADNT